MTKDADKIKILINTPNYKDPTSGGVANHYYGLQRYWTENVIYNIVGSRGKSGRGKYWLIWDLVKFIIKILFWRPAIIVLNPSLAPNALKRDSIFLNIGKKMNKKVVVCFHGFDFKYGETLNHQKFISQFNKADGFLVLSKKIRTTLQCWGISVPIYLYTTKVDDRLVDRFNVRRKTGNVINISYIARVTKDKGIFITLDIFKILSEQYPQLRFNVVGSGDDLDKAKNYASTNQIENIRFTGNVSGINLINEFLKADIYLFTSYHEGMPTSVLEAMAFGLPVITRPVGGLVDFFENGKMGEMVDSYNPTDFVVAIELLLTKKEKVKEISYYNHEYAMKRFLASSVAKSIEEAIINIHKAC